MAVNVSVKGYNFDLIQNQSDTTFKIQLVSKDGTTVYDTQDATVDTAASTATAALTAPSNSSDNTRSGTEYTVRTILCGEVDSTHIAILTISSPASINSITLSTTKIAASAVTSGQTTDVKISGWNFGAHSNITLQFYDSTNTAYGSPLSIDRITSAEYSEVWQKGGVTIVTGSTTLDEINVAIEIPTVDDMYTLKVLFDGNANSKTASLQVYGAPVFTSFKIPNAGTSKAYSTVAAVVKGKNFTAPDITASSFAVACASKPYIASGAVVTVASDSRLTVSLNIPDAVGEYAVTVSCGSESYEGTFTVKDTSKYKVGQIVLADGNLVESSSYTKIDESNPPVAVVAGFNGKGVALGVGLHISSSELQWAPKDSTGYNTFFKDIVCTPSETGEGAADTATFTGDVDGSDNWDEICSVDQEGSADAATNYPAFNWVNNYGRTYSKYLGGVTDGWYMPSIAELCYVYRNFETIDVTLSVIYGLDSSYAQSSLGTSWFWSSSQYSDDYDDAWSVDFSDGWVNHYLDKGYNISVLVIRAL